MSIPYRSEFAILFLICAPLLGAQDQNDSNVATDDAMPGLRIYALAAFQQWTGSPFAGTTGVFAAVKSARTSGRLRYSFLYSSVYSRPDGSYFRTQSPAAPSTPSFIRMPSGSGSELNNIDNFDQFVAFTGEYGLTSGATSFETSRTVLLFNINEDLFGINNSAAPTPASDIQRWQPGSAPLLIRGLNDISTPTLSQTLPLLFGGHVLASRVAMALAYRKTPRLNVALSLAGNRTEAVSGSPNSQQQPAYRFPVTNTAAATLQTSYLLSPRTQVGVVASDQEMLSGYLRGRATGLSALIAHHLTERLEGELYAGASNISTRHVADMLLPANLQLTFHAALHYEARSSNLGLSFDRSPLDPYGAGASATSGVTGTWRYSGLGRRTALQIETGWQQLTSPVSGSLQGMQCNAALIRNLNRQTSAEIRYVFARVITSPANPISGSFQQIRLTFSWLPTSLRIF